MNAKGMSLIEVILAAMVLSFMVAATARVYQVGEKQQRTARAYSLAQSDIRRGLQRLTRTVRHGYQVVAASANFGGASSGLNQVVVEVPEPGGTTRGEIRFYLSGGTLYAQKQSEAAPGTALVTGVQALELKYYQTDSGTGIASVVAPALATEVDIKVTAKRDPAVTTVRAYVNLRNAIGASL